jgi:hypothetical protein
MTLIYDGELRKLQISWSEPIHARYKGRDIVLPKIKSRRLAVSKRGNIRFTDLSKLPPDTVPEVMRFHRMLDDKGAFSDATFPCRCSVCGSKNGVSACYDSASGKFLHLCNEHKHRIFSKEMNKAKDS